MSLFENPADMKDDGFDLPTFDSAETYFFLIDDELKTEIMGETYVCLNPEHDVWQPLKSLPSDVLKRIAVRCVTSRQNTFKKTSPIPLIRESLGHE